MGRWYNTTFMGLMVGEGGGYAEKVLSYGPIAYWPLWELSGVTAQCLVNPAQNGTYTGVTLGQPGIGDGNTAPLFDGANDFVDVYSATLASVFDGSEGTLLFWAKPFNAGVWSDATWRDFVSLKADANNWVQIEESGGGIGVYTYKAGGVNEEGYPALAGADWRQLAITWSKTDDEMIKYLAGIQSGAAHTLLGVWAGVLAVTTCIIGADDNVPTNPWYGYIAHTMIFDRALPPADIADLNVV